MKGHEGNNEEHDGYEYEGNYVKDAENIEQSFALPITGGRNDVVFHFTAKNQKLKAVEEEVIEEHLIEEKVIKKANQFKEFAGLSGHEELTHPTTNMKTTYNTTKMQKTYNR